ncbi:GroES-like protein [Polyplosphaeria fusca]|uniref:GroES-like protein n=1 Tax=Polyplosphaeria fusca TaxID=682080 RepID=A0A9P4QXC6_9PLEO|nr:GroES-like protein [Polyplosphaeria fusca]
MPSFTVYKGSQDGTIKKSSTTMPDLTNDQVLVRITASGLCGTDEHFRTSDMVLGHEGMGIVQETGPGVQHLKKGDRVGWGYEQSACGNCEMCLTGRDTFCADRELYGEANLDNGSFASHAVRREAFLFAIPDSISDIDAAPLQCGGATVFNALRMYNVQPTDRVGIIGVGGLGHLAIQFASKMGCEVVVLSGSESKREEAMRLGASQFVAMKGKTSLDIGAKLNVLLVTTSMQPSWDLILPVMAPDSIVFPLTVSEDHFQIPYMPFLMAGIRIQASIVAARHIHRKMLHFAAQHNIRPIVQEFPMSEEGINKAMQTLNDGHMRYRGVLIPQ